MLPTDRNILLEEEEQKDFRFDQLAGGICFVSLIGSWQNAVKSLVI